MKSHSSFSVFGFSIVVSVICMGLALYWGGFVALYLTLLLALLEVSLSFDNAVVNASVLKHMSEKWQQLFLTVGIIIAVFGMRLIFPILIVAFAANQSWMLVAQMALNEPDQYARYIGDAHINIALFGGMFLLMVFLYFICDTMKDVHWLGGIERKLAKLGQIESLEIVIALILLVIIQATIAPEDRLSSIFSGLLGIVLFVIINSLDSVIKLFIGEDKKSPVGNVAKTGIVGFLYLEVLDASFSLDGVVGAFAVSRDVVIIMLGLTIGAVFVRSLTIFLVRKGTLNDYIYLEHGAHYAIGALAMIMFISTNYHVPEWLAGTIGVILIGLSLYSSLRHNRLAESV